MPSPTRRTPHSPFTPSGPFRPIAECRSRAFRLRRSELRHHLGPTTRPSDLATTDLPVGQLPISGDTTSEAIPFGNATLTLIAGPRGQLGGALGAELPWIFLVAGVLLTIATAVTTEQLVRRRRLAEEDAQTIAGLYVRLDGLYGAQRSIAETLQRALLPQSNPSIPNLEIASRYVAGADGVDIGGDWYSLIPVDEQRFAFAVGDVSGRGIERGHHHGAPSVHHPGVPGGRTSAGCRAGHVLSSDRCRQ